MNINCQADPCPVLVNASCVFYEGPNLICLGVNTNETLESALGKINSLFCQVLSQQGSSGTSGTSGSSGSSGTRGSSGSSGSSGSNGRNGSSGSSGTSGEQGDQYRTVSETCFTLGDAGTIFVEPGLAYTPAQSITISFDVFNYQICEIVSYNSITGELVFTLPTTVVGTPAEYCQWNVNLNGVAGGDGSSGTSGSDGTSGASCLSAVIENISIDSNLNIIYYECNDVYQNYDIGPGNILICYKSGTLELIGDYIINPQGLCNGTSGTSGLTCTSLEVTNITLDARTYNYTDCIGDDIFVEIPAEQFISICATSWEEENENFDVFENGVCNGTSGTSGTSGAGTGGGATCPDHFKLAAVSGKFRSNNANSPTLKDMFSGNDQLGWSYGLYDEKPLIDGFGNLISLKYDLTNHGIPLPIDLNVGDTIRISGIAHILFGGTLPVNPIFYVTVSRFTCKGVIKGKNTLLYTVIPVASYPISLDIGKVCFSESIILSSILASDETFFVVGFGIGNDELLATVDVKFSYTLDVTQACIGTTGQNLLISNCCDPAYTNIIINNLVPIGESFVDTDGNCWTVEAETLNAVTAVRTKSTEYADCDACIDANPCPENFTIQGCCGGDGEVFSAALLGVNVGDTFVDTNGFCWSAIDTTPLPITNIVEVGTVYPITDCLDAVCTDLNDCPTPVLLTSCCGRTLSGFTTLELLQAALPTLAIGDVFVDTFGMCWEIKDSDYAFPNLAFIVPVTEYQEEGLFSACEECITDNECPTDFYYTVQNCCTEEIEVVVLEAVYPVGEVLNLVLDVAFGCYKVLSWSDVGTITATVDVVAGVSKTCDDCLVLMEENFGGTYCQGQTQCCTIYKNIDSLPTTISGYTCDGTWLYNYVMTSGEVLCMAILTKFDKRVVLKQGCCAFDIFNPSATETISISYSVCPQGAKDEIIIPPLTTFTEQYFAITGNETCLSCVLNSKGVWEYQPCPF